MFFCGSRSGSIRTARIDLFYFFGNTIRALCHFFCQKKAPEYSRRMKKTLSERILWLCEACGLSESVLSKAAGIPRSRTNTVTCGKVRNPRVDFVAAIAVVTGASIDWLVTGSGEPPSAKALRRAGDTARAKILLKKKNGVAL